MVRRFGLSARILGGFAIVLVLLIIVAYVGYRGLSGVIDEVEKMEKMNRIIGLMFQARLDEMRFVMEADTSDVNAVSTNVEQIKAEAEQTKRQSEQQRNKHQMSRVIKEVDDYAEAFRSYVDLEGKKADILSEAKQKADMALKQTEEIRAAMKEQLFAYWNESQKLIADSLEKAEDAEHLLRLVLQAETLRITLMGKYTTQVLKDWDSINEEIFTLTRAMKSKFIHDRDKRLADEILLKYRQFLAAFSRYQLTQMELDLKKLKQKAQESMNAMEAIRENQMMELERVQTSFKKELDDKLKIADYANLMNKWLLDARMNEKEIVISRNYEHMGVIEDRIQKILTLGEYLRTLFKTGEDLKRVNDTIETVRSYRQAFNTYVELTRAQEKVAAFMTKTALDAQRLTDAVRTDQRTRLESEIASANRIMVLGTVMAVLCGVLLTFSITRAIVNPIKTVVVKTAHAIAEGDFSQEIAIRRSDEIGALADAFRNMRDKIRQVLQETDRLIQAVQHRRLDIRGNTEGFHGSWRELVVGINNVVDAFKLQEQLILYDKLASVGLLAAGVAHEINNPLEIIYNYLRYIERKFHDAKLQEAIRNIHEEIASIATIVSNLHSFSDNKKLVVEQIVLNELIRSILTLIKHSARNKQIALHFDPPHDAIVIQANKNEIKQVILNLLKNSFESMTNGGRIEIETGIVREGGSALARITFTDTGPGIQIENPSDIFLPFFSTKKGQEGNLGLGLSVSYGIVKKYNGTISVRNIDKPRSGCQFVIDLPLSV